MSLVASTSRNDLATDLLDRSLAAQLSLEDIEYLERLQRRNRRDGIVDSDAVLALFLSAEEARSTIMFNNDRALAQALQDHELPGQL